MPATAKATHRKVRSGNSFRPVTNAHSVVELAAALQNVQDETEFAYGNVLASDQCDLPCILDAGFDLEDQLELAEAVSAMRYFLHSWERRGLVIREIKQPAWDLPRLEMVFRCASQKIRKKLRQQTLLLAEDEDKDRHKDVDGRLGRRSESLAPQARQVCLGSSLALIAAYCMLARLKKLN